MTMRYIKFTKSDISDLHTFGVCELLVEVSPTGSIEREIGLDQLSQVIHRFPGEGTFGRYGIFDNATLEVEGLEDDISAAEFNKLYS